MFKKITLAAATVAVCVAVSPASADTIPGSRFGYGNWKGNAFSDQDGFTHCAISTSYRSGISLHFAIDQNYKWRIGFSNPEWNMKKGETFDIRYQVDRHRIISAKAHVFGRTFVMAELVAKDRIFNQFRRGRTLRVEAGNKDYSFSLRGTSRALKSVLNCVNGYIDYIPSASVSRNAKPGAGPGRTNLISSSPQDMLAATRFMIGLFSSNDYAGYKLLDQEILTKPGSPSFLRTAAVGWTGGGATGSLHVLNGKAVTPPGALAKMIANDAKHCLGSFASGSKQSQHNNRVHTGFTACKKGAAYKFYVDYIAFPKGDEKVYLISNMQIDKARIDQSISESFSRNVGYVID